LKLLYDVATVRIAIVPPTRIMPVTEKSFCVIPCCTRSPIITSRIRSNGSSDESSRRPTTRVRKSTKTKPTAARMTRSMR
jgi:hypothetical protein